jgi:hypothetical protein
MEMLMCPIVVHSIFWHYPAGEFFFTMSNDGFRESRTPNTSLSSVWSHGNSALASFDSVLCEPIITDGIGDFAGPGPAHFRGGETASHTTGFPSTLDASFENLSPVDAGEFFRQRTDLTVCIETLTAANPFAEFPEIESTNLGWNPHQSSSGAFVPDGTGWWADVSLE